jgi:hypothetical protein
MWGPFLSDREWGTVREDYSPNGNAWNYFPFEDAISRTYRWSEDGIGGICDEKQIICFAPAFWNGKDRLIKERLFGLTNAEGNHGEDVKEYYYYLDNIPSHNYMKMLYKYPQSYFPYEPLRDENKKRTRDEREFELIDTGIFNEDKYFDIFIEYAKNNENDILIKITACNRGTKKVLLNIIPQIWFRNTWSWGYENYVPEILFGVKGSLNLKHKSGDYNLYYENSPDILFCNNETNSKKIFGIDSDKKYFKDGINNFIVNKIEDGINRTSGTKAGINYQKEIDANGSLTIRLRLSKYKVDNPFNDFEETFQQRINEANDFYKKIQHDNTDEDERNIQRQAFAGMLWNKQFYNYDLRKWLSGDPSMPVPPEERKNGRNSDWFHLNNSDIISMPDNWEFPWYATWDLAFHCITLSMIDPEYAKEQLILLTREWYMHPNGQLPAYEWNFSDVNPPVHAYAAWRIYKIDEKQKGKGDTEFLERILHKLLINFTWWVNKKDFGDRNIFQGGFLGMDNVGVFDRSSGISPDERLDQADGTSWMAMYSLNMMRIALELSKEKPYYQDIATKFFEHFLYIAGAMVNIDCNGMSLWDEDDQFYYDVLHFQKDDKSQLIKIRSMVGLIPLFAVEVLDSEILDALPEFTARMDWFLNYRPDLANLVSRWNVHGVGQRHLLSLLRGSRMKKLIKRMLDETEYLSGYGVRSLSKVYKDNPYEFSTDGTNIKVKYSPAESETNIFGGNSNWRGPIWFPANFLIIESLQRFHHYYGDDFLIEYPINSGKTITIKDAADEIAKRLLNIYLKDKNGRRAVYGNNEKFQTDPNFKDYILFYEYFNGDTGEGLGASHQTGWTGLLAKLIQPRRKNSQP